MRSVYGTLQHNESRFSSHSFEGCGKSNKDQKNFGEELSASSHHSQPKQAVIVEVVNQEVSPYIHQAIKPKNQPKKLPPFADRVKHQLQHLPPRKQSEDQDVMIKELVQFAQQHGYYP